MKKIITFSIYNNRPKDVLMLICNVLISPCVYPGWNIRIFYDKSVSKECIEILNSFNHTEMVNMQNHWLSVYDKKMWRFLPASDQNVDIMISRDADSLLSKREFVCVEDWISSNKSLHILRDHCYHSKEIMAGLWGIKKNTLNIEKSLLYTVQNHNKDKIGDQDYLKYYVYEKIDKENIMIHTCKQYAMNKEIPYEPGEEIWKKGGYFPKEKINLIPEYEEWDEWIKEISFKKINSVNKFLCAHCRKEHEVFCGNILTNFPRETILKLESVFKDHGYDIYSIKFSPEISIID